MFGRWIGVAAIAVAVSDVLIAEQTDGRRPGRDATSAAATRPSYPYYALRGPKDFLAGISPGDRSKAGTPEHARFVCRLSNAPAVDVANAIKGFLRSELECTASGAATPFATLTKSVAIEAEPVSNSVMVSGTPTAVEEVRKLIADLDKPPPTVVVEVVVGEGPAGSGADSSRAIGSPPKTETIARVHLMTLDNQTAFVQIGQRIPVFGGADDATGKGKGNPPTMENVGLTLGVTPRVTPDNETIVMEIDFEKSQRGPETEQTPVPADGAVRPVRIDKLLVQTTVRVANGRTVVLDSIGGRAKSDKELFITLTGHVLKAGKD